MMVGRFSEVVDQQERDIVPMKYLVFGGKDEDVFIFRSIMRLEVIAEIMGDGAGVIRQMLSACDVAQGVCSWFEFPVVVGVAEQGVAEGVGVRVRCNGSPMQGPAQPLSQEYMNLASWATRE